MLFSSIPFLNRFLPVVLLMYFIVPAKLKNIVLLISSLFFYAWGEPTNVVIMLISVFCSYVLGIYIEKYRGTKKGRLIFILSVAISIGFLVYFKYMDFFIRNINAATGIGIRQLNIALPIGISFYTFQIISYTVDVEKGEKAQKNFIALATYISMFPQLIAGPIVRYSDIRDQLKERRSTITKSAEGIRRFILGLAKKILLANQLGELCTIFAGVENKSIVFYWVYALAFTMHVYFDFSGYSDMAIGLGKIFGFEFLENFNYPFISSSITEFWRRWHMSLGTWFRDYVYIPLGGNRNGRFKQLRNILIVWMLTGFWHGAEWNFILWGLFFAVLLVVEKSGLLSFLKQHKIVAHVYVLFMLMISFVIFNAENMSVVWRDLQGMFGMAALPLINAETVYYIKSFSVILLISMIGSTPFVTSFVSKIKEDRMGSKVLNVLEPVVLTVLMVVMTAYLVDGSFNPFLYFRF